MDLTWQWCVYPVLQLFFSPPLFEFSTFFFRPFRRRLITGERLKSSWLEDHREVVRLLSPCEDQHGSLDFFHRKKKHGGSGKRVPSSKGCLF